MAVILAAKKPTLFLLLLILVQIFSNSVQYKLEETILPPWMDSYGTGPNITLYVCFREDSCVENGDVFSLNETYESPYVTMAGCDLKEEEGYAYICVDADEYNPKNPYAKNELHWIVANIPGSIKPYQHIADTGKIVLPYLRPRKPFFYRGDFGVHRYYNLLYKQVKLDQNITYDGSIRHFSIRNFTNTYKLGYPVAGVVYKVDYNTPSHNFKVAQV